MIIIANLIKLSQVARDAAVSAMTSSAASLRNQNERFVFEESGTISPSFDGHKSKPRWRWRRFGIKSVLVWERWPIAICPLFCRSSIKSDHKILLRFLGQKKNVNNGQYKNVLIKKLSNVIPCNFKVMQNGVITQRIRILFVDSWRPQFGQKKQQPHI